MSTEPQQWIVVRNWERFQHYRDRQPTWIKFYLELLQDEAYLGLRPRTRCLLHGIWLLFAGSRGVLPALPRRLSGALNLQVTRSDLELLNQAGFIEFVASKPLAHRYQAASPRAFARERARENPPKGGKERRSGTPNGAASDANKNNRRRTPYELAELFTRNTLPNYPEPDRRVALAEYHLTTEQEDQLLALAAELDST